MKGDRTLRGFIDEFMDVQLVVEEFGGFPAFADKLVGEDVVRSEDKLLVYASRVSVEKLPPRTARFQPAPFLWFLICDATGRTDGFVVDIETALEALGRAHNQDRELLSVPAYVARDPEAAAVRAGAERHLTMRVVELDQPSSTAALKTGIRFELAGENLLPLYSFTIGGLTSLLTIAVPLLGNLPFARQPSFAEELDELVEELDVEIDKKEQGRRSASPTEPSLSTVQLPAVSLDTFGEAELDDLDDRIAHVLRMRSGMLSGEAPTLKEVGEELGISRERVRQLERYGLALIRAIREAQRHLRPPPRGRRYRYPWTFLKRQPR